MLSDKDVTEIKLKVAMEFDRQLQVEWERIRHVLSQTDSPEFRETLAQSLPESARLFEMHTLEERERRGHDLATASAVGHAVVYGFGLIGPYFLSS